MLGRFCRDLEQANRDVGEPTASSIAADDARTGDHPAVFGVLRSQVEQLVLMGRDHIAVAGRVVRFRRGAAPVWSLLRGSAEGSARALWLLAADGSARERAGRSLGVRWNEQRRQELVMEELRDGGKATRDEFAVFTDVVERRRRHLARQAEGVGAEVRSTSAGDVKRVGEEPLSFTDLFGREFQEAETYRILSALVHGQAWARLQATLAEVRVEAPKGMRAMVRSADPATLLWAVGRVAEYCAMAERGQLAYLGYDDREVARAHERLGRQLARLTARVVRG